MKKEFWLVIALGIIIIILLAVLVLPKNMQSQDIKNLSVKSGQKITSPLVVEGQTRLYFFEGSFPIQITDEAGNVLGQSYVQATEDWMTENFVPFKGQIEFISEKEQKGFLVLKKDNPSGLPENDKETKIPVVIMPPNPAETMKVKVYFNNSKMDPEASCNKVFPVERIIPKTESVATASLRELLKGPTDSEKNEGYFTSINEGVKIQSLMIGMDSGTAWAGFSEELEKGVGGSCRVSAIRAQITQTLMQFPTIKSVVISIDGRTEDILQP